MPKYKILNSLRNNNNLNIYMKNREEIYKDLYKNVGIKNYGMLSGCRLLKE